MDLAISMCHLCAIKCDYYLEIFSDAGKQLEIAAIIAQHFWFEIDEPNNYNETSKIICQQCWAHLYSFHQFYTNIEKIHGRFEFQNILKVEQNPGNDTDFDVLHDEKILDVKDFLHDLNDIGTDQLENNEDVKEERKFYPSKTIKCSIKRNGVRAEKDAYLRSFFHMDCDICNSECLSFSEARRHYQHAHNVPGYVRCCSKKFYNQRTMRHHIAMHVNPKALICDLCSKGFAHKSRLRDHMRTHTKPEDRQFKCDQCTKAFLKQCQLVMHQKVKHSNDDEKEFGCDQCGKRFVLYCLLQNHKTQVHSSKNSYVCHICAKVYSSYANYLTHKKQSHEDPIPPIQCNVCGVWLKQYSLRKHLKIHNDTEQMCQFCFRVLKNKRTLQKHISEVHSDRKTFVCNVCGKEYRRALNLQEHMSSHTGAILYSCTFCPKTFNSSSNMYKHRKTVHPIEYQISKADHNGQIILKSAALALDL